MYSHIYLPLRTASPRATVKQPSYQADSQKLDKMAATRLTEASQWSVGHGHQNCGQPHMSVEARYEHSSIKYDRHSEAISTAFLCGPISEDKKKKITKSHS